MSSHPVVKAQHEHRSRHLQLRVADAITAFAGSMTFIYVHMVIFAVWCATGLFGHDKFPFNFLTMAVSLEAIFLATFVLIGQNRQAAFAQAKAEHDFVEQEEELHANTAITQAVHDLAKDMHAVLITPPPPPPPVRKPRKPRT